jgi:hypothetical protein
VITGKRLLGMREGNELLQSTGENCTGSHFCRRPPGSDTILASFYSRPQSSWPGVSFCSGRFPAPNRPLTSALPVVRSSRRSA